MNARRARVAQILPAAAAWIVALAYRWWFTDLEPFSPTAFRALVVAVVVLIVVAQVHRARRAPRASDGGNA